MDGLLPIWSTFVRYSLNTFLWIFFLIVVLFIYREQVKNFLNSFTNIWNKATKMEVFGFNLHLGSETPLVGQRSQTLGTYQNSLIKNEAEIIRKQLIDQNLNEQQAVSLLISQLATANFLIVMNIADKHIYNEQIELLEYLNTHPSPQPQSELYPFFNKWQKRTQNTEYQFSEFLNYLLKTCKLIIETVDGYSISQLGIEYLSFIVRIGRPTLSGKSIVE